MEDKIVWYILYVIYVLGAYYNFTLFSPETVFPLMDNELKYDKDIDLKMKNFIKKHFLIFRLIISMTWPIHFLIF
jgi:hypothetical protein